MSYLIILFCTLLTYPLHELVGNREKAIMRCSVPCKVNVLYFIFVLEKRERIEFAVTATKYDRRFKVLFS